MTFLNPIWFLALGAVLIPLVIHLWNIRQGKVLKVGSILLMGAASRQSSRSLRVQDLLLLVLRCLFLMLLAGLLAMPFWSRFADNSKVKGWVMIPKQCLKQALAKFKKPLDSLTAQGYEFHYFDEGFARANLSELASDTSKWSDTSVSNYWDLLLKLNHRVPARLPICLFTENRLRHFSGNKPALSLNLRWTTYIPADSVSQWVEKAWFTSDHHIRVVKGSSNPRETRYTAYTLQPGQSNAQFDAEINNKGAFVSLKSKSRQGLAADTSTFRIGYVADPAQADARYLSAALQAIMPLIPHKVQLTRYSNAARIQQKQDWLFWLTEKPVDKVASDLSSNLFIYQTGKAQNLASWFGPAQGFEVAGRAEQVPLYQLITSAKADADLIWRDGFGHAVLSCEKDKGFSLYRFYGRFNPAWSDLVWNDNFPRMLLGLMVNVAPSAQSLQYDKRVSSIQQILPVLSRGSSPRLAEVADEIDLSHQLWLVLILVFMIERFLSYKKTNVSNG